MEFVAKFAWIAVVIFFFSGDWKFVQDRLSPRVGKIYRTAGWLLLIASCFFLCQHPERHWVREVVAGPIVVTVRTTDGLPVVDTVSFNGVEYKDICIAPETKSVEPWVIRNVQSPRRFYQWSQAEPPRPPQLHAQPKDLVFDQRPGK